MVRLNGLTAATPPAATTPPTTPPSTTWRCRSALPALFGFNVFGSLTMVYGELRTGGDYGIDVTAKNAPETLPVGGVGLHLLGCPRRPQSTTPSAFAPALPPTLHDHPDPSD